MSRKEKPNVQSKFTVHCGNSVILIEKSALVSLERHINSDLSAASNCCVLQSTLYAITNFEAYDAIYMQCGLRFLHLRDFFAQQPNIMMLSQQ